MTKTKKEILGLIYIGAGSTWCVDKDETSTAVQCAKMCKSDWGHLFKFKRHENFKVNLYDVSNKNWSAESGGVFEKGTNERIPLLKVATVVV